MLKFSEDFEARREKLNALVKESVGKEDENILKVLYSVTNIENYHEDESKLEGVNGTYFKDLETKDLLKQFTKEVFNGKGNRYYEELFQEIYNRQTKFSNYEPRYVVEVSGEEGTTNGFMRHGTNMLNINGGMIEKYKKVDEFNENNTDRKNANTIGAHSLLTLIHETQHTFQSEGMMKFALNEEKNEHDRMRNAICLARMSLIYYINSDDVDLENPEVKEIQDLVRNNYWFDYMEHDSNMAPIKFLNRQIKNGNLPDKVFIKAGRQRVKNDIHINKVLDEKEIPETLKERAEKMEQIVKGYQKYFSKVMKDGEIKNQVCGVLNDCLNQDQNGKSKFAKSLNEDFNMCLDYIAYANKVAPENDSKLSDFKASNLNNAPRKYRIVKPTNRILKVKNAKRINKEDELTNI